MDKETRNLIFNTTQAIRRLLAEEFALQLEGTFDVHPDGRVADQPGPQLTPAERLVRQRIIEAIQHRRAGGEAAIESVRGFQSEAVFTFLNRLAALKMMEARGLVLPCVSQGDQSQGFKEFSGLAPGLIELPDKGYRLYLECLFDEIGREVGVLFDRTDAASQLWPRRKALEAALEKLNNPELAGVWVEDETIGWIYQYYNDPEERKQMREDSSAPRNSRELAVRNQFFTPRYVVAFLTDNTLGRIWYEMTRGETKLKEQCRYLVRRPNEIFLKPGETAPAQAKQDNVSQEDLLKLPVHISHRPIKDPRTILMLDPACGSMHFGLYAFELFEVIYAEAWDLEGELGDEALNRQPGLSSLHQTYPNKDAFLRDVPRLIIEHNIHGIDIDPRAAQIAGLALWLRAQKAWQKLGIKPVERPAIRRSNIVCAEPMPGEKDLLREFVDKHFSPAERPLFQRLLESVWEKMQLAGEAGSLLKIEEEIRTLVANAKLVWKEGPKFEQTALFPEAEVSPRQKEMRLDLSGITDEQFFDRVEDRIYAALRDYAEQAENGGGFQRRLFAEDAARGFAFIDVCRKHYDVVLMNPPFGTSSESAKDYIFNNFDREKIELGACFVGANLKKLASGGCVGVIANRTMLFSRTFEDWRRSALSGLLLCADFGDGVLDALVETAAFTVTNHPCSQSVFFKLLDAADKGSELQNCTVIRPVALSERRIFSRPLSAFAAIDGCVFAYWLPDSLLTKFTTMPKAATRKLVARSGLQTCDNFRFLRLAWEISFADGDVVESWPRLTKGGDYQPFWSDTPLLINWHNEGSEIKVFIDQLYGQWSKQIPSVNLYRFPGATYTERTTSAISLRVLPRNCLFDKKGPFIGFPDGSFDQSVVLQFIALSYTTPIKAIIESSVGLRDATASGSPARDYLPSLIERLCFPHLPPDVATEVGTASRVCVLRHRAIEAGSEVSSVWSPMNSCSMHGSLAALARNEMRTLRGRLSEIYAAFMTIEERSLSAFGVTRAEAGSLREILGESVFQFENSECEVEADVLNALANLSEDQLVDVVAGSHGKSPATLKQAFVGDRLTELLSFHFRRHPLSILRRLEALQIVADSHNLATAVAVVSEALGFAFGRWDIRYATGEQAAPELPDPFAPLSVCPPGQLQNAQGLPARPEDVPAAYPVRIPWDGILVDDPNHQLDIIERVREVLRVIWKDRAEAIEHEACEIIGVKALRDYFQKPSAFFADHLSRYSKSRRQAPIYWPLSSPNGLYTVWLYYHRLTPDTLFTVQRDHLKPKLEYEERRAFQFRQEAGATPSPSQRRDIAEAEELVEDLRAFKAELERVAPLFRPNLNDGVIINYAPLWRLIGLPKWRKDCQAIWNELLKTEYDWAHLALHLWPERVIPKCATDRSLAIAHGLDETFWQEDQAKPGKWIVKKVPEAEVQRLIASRTSPAVKAALESLTGAGASDGAPRRAKKKSGA